MNPESIYQALKYKKIVNCRKYKKILPDLKPYISNLSHMKIHHFIIVE